MHGIFASPRLLSSNENMHLAAHERLQDPPKRGSVVTRIWSEKIMVKINHRTVSVIALV